MLKAPPTDSSLIVNISSVDSCMQAVLTFHFRWIGVKVSLFCSAVLDKRLSLLIALLFICLFVCLLLLFFFLVVVSFFLSFFLSLNYSSRKTFSLNLMLSPDCRKHWENFTKVCLVCIPLCYLCVFCIIIIISRRFRTV